MFNAGMRIVIFAVLAAAVASTGLGGIAHAQDASGADLAITAPAYEGFYLRADLGIGQWTGEPGQQELTDNGGSFVDDSIDRNAVLMGGIGWQAGNGLRFDVTGEYRTKAGIEALRQPHAAAQQSARHPAGQYDLRRRSQLLSSASSTATGTSRNSTA